MKIIFPIISFCLLMHSAYAKSFTYTASTPAGNIVKKFLGIPLLDSVDFIRWRITLDKNEYTLHCSYGISKPNTNGFINEKNISLKGLLKKDRNYYQLSNGSKQRRTG